MILMTPIWQKKPEFAPSSTPEATPAPSTPPILRESMPTLSYSAELVTNCGGGGALGWRALQPDELTCGGISNGVDCSLNSHQRDTLHGDGSCGNSDSAMNSNPEANDSAGGPSDGSQWPKVRMGRTALERLLADLPDGTSDTELANKLFELLTWVNDSYFALHALFISINFTHILLLSLVMLWLFLEPLLHNLLDGWAGRRDLASFHQPLPPHSLCSTMILILFYILLPPE